MDSTTKRQIEQAIATIKKATGQDDVEVVIYSYGNIVGFCISPVVNHNICRAVGKCSGYSWNTTEQWHGVTDRKD